MTDFRRAATTPPPPLQVQALAQLALATPKQVLALQEPGAPQVLVEISRELV